MSHTTFGDLEVGAKFVLPGETAVMVKVNLREAKKAGARSRRLTLPVQQRVVPETGATVGDILGSWGRL